MDYTQSLEITYEQLQERLAECQSKLAGLEPRWFDVADGVQSYGTMFYVFGSVSIVKSTDHMGVVTISYRSLIERFASSNFQDVYAVVNDVDQALWKNGPAAKRAVEAAFKVAKQAEADHVSRV
jgi:hypothetical protein